MSRVRTFFASLALTTSLVGFAVPQAEARSFKPVPVAPIQIKPSPQDTLRMQVKKALAERRKVTMERFLAYREGRVYPVNSKIQGAAHVWMDEFGNLCAAATIIAQDWGRAAAEAVSRDNNNIALASITKGELFDWILTSGMTKAEIVSIQVPSVGPSGRWDGRPTMPIEPDIRTAENLRLYQLYTDVERQIRSLDKHNLDLAVDALMKHPQLARDLVAGKTAGAGHYLEAIANGTDPSTPVAPMPAPEPLAVRQFAKPPQ
jgi:hypothetical protein